MCRRNKRQWTTATIIITFMLISVTQGQPTSAKLELWQQQKRPIGVRNETIIHPATTVDSSSSSSSVTEEEDEETGVLVSQNQLLLSSAYDYRTTTPDNPLVVEAEDDLPSSSSSSSRKGRLDCVSRKRTFDGRRHKRKYRLAVHAIRGFEAAYREYNRTFAEYLTATAGQRFDPPIEFEMVPVTFQGLFESVEKEEVDLFYANPGIYSCVGVERGAQPLATIVSRLEVRGNLYDLDVFGGVIFTRADNDHITTIQHLKDTIVAAGAISMILAGQVQFYEMMMAGMSYVMDPKQVVFTGNQYDIVNGVLEGDFDVGFVRTDTIERTIGRDGKPVDPDAFRVLQPRIHVLEEDGNLFPFLHSTDIYPEWPVSALTHVPQDVAEEVQQALLALQAHAKTGSSILDEHSCYNRGTCDMSNISTRCDTSEALAILANVSATAGKLAGFRNARSYFEVRSMHEAGGFMTQDSKGRWKCTRASTLYDGIQCPADHYKLPVEEFENSCENSGVPCNNEKYECFCKPCVKAFEVDVFQYDNVNTTANTTTAYGNVSSHTNMPPLAASVLAGRAETTTIAASSSSIAYSERNNNKGCTKMSLCGSVEQTKTITFRVVDNRKRRHVIASATIHIGRVSSPLDIYRVPKDEFTYEFSFSQTTVGVAIIEIYMNGQQIPESPIRAQIIPGNCDHKGQDKVPDPQGICICREGTVSIRNGNKCVRVTIIAIVASLTMVVLIAYMIHFYTRYKHTLNDQLWTIRVEELEFEDPVEVIGQGSFGVVLLAEYRGTKVAIKRALKTSYRRRGEEGSSTKGSPSLKYGRGGSQSSSRKSTTSRGMMAAATNTITNKKGKQPTASESIIRSNDLIMMADYDASLLSVQDPEEERGEPGGLARTEEDSAETSAGGEEDATGMHSLGFLTKDFSQGGKFFEGCCFWRQQKDHQSRFQESLLLGSSAGSSAVQHPSSSFLSQICPYLDKRQRQREEFISEMRLLSRLRHPCITTVVGAVMARDHDPMLVMEYMEYGSLHALLCNETMLLTGEVILQIVRDVAQGIRFLHSSKPPVLHGDLKASNILMDSRFRAKVCDFGFAAKSRKCITGTPYWLAPEYLRGDTNYTPACDIYSLGIILFEIYSRENPYEGEDFRDVLRQVCDRRINKRPFLPRACPPKMVNLMKKLWGPNPHIRPCARELDSTVMELSSQDAEPVSLLTDQGDERTSDMLYDIFPKYIANALKAGQKMEPEDHEMVTVVFSDIIRFTDISRELSPMKVSNMLDRLYLAFDRIARSHDVFKVETIGDAYMGVTNLEANQNETHVKHIAEFAMSMIREANKIFIDEDDPEKGHLNIRVGFHSGPVVTDVIGSLNPRYGLFGDTVNTANRMESNSAENRILCSERSYKLLREQAPEIQTTHRGRIFIKGKGDMDVYWVNGAHDQEQTSTSKKKQVVFKDEEPTLPETRRPHTKTNRAFVLFSGEMPA